MKMKWKISGVGHAVLMLTLPEANVELHTTYVGDGLGSVLRSAADLSRGSASSFSFLPAEPGGSCMFFANAKDEVYLQIVRFSDMTSLARRWSGGQLVWAGHIGVSEFISEAVAMAEEVLVNSGGADSYADLWGGIEFPMDLLRTLRGVGDL